MKVNSFKVSPEIENENKKSEEKDETEEKEKEEKEQNKEFRKYLEIFDIIKNNYNHIKEDHDNKIHEYQTLLKLSNSELEEINNNLNNLNFPKSNLQELKAMSNEIKAQNVKLKIFISTISSNINDLDNIYENITKKNEIIQTKLINVIDYKIEEFKANIANLKKDFDLYNNKKNRIENDTKNIKDEINEHKNKVDNLFKIINEELKKQIEKFLGDSLLIYNKYDTNKIFKSENIFKDNNEPQIEKPTLLFKNWNEICYIYNDYDIHEINFELKAKGVPEDNILNLCSIGLSKNLLVNILNLEIDGKKSNCAYKNNSIRFEINLENEQSNKIHLKYKESLLIDKLTDEEKNLRKFHRYKSYGIKKVLMGQNAKFTLINSSDFEIINFDDEIFTKIKNNEYMWGGIVPSQGKKTNVRMSKSNGTFYFERKEILENLGNMPLDEVKLIVPCLFEGGNNEIINLTTSSIQANKIQRSITQKSYEVKFINKKEKILEFNIKCKLKNRCKGEWSCNLTDDEIEAEIPEDVYKYKKVLLDKAKEIIKKYDEEHINDFNEVTDMVKIGKWVTNNIEYAQNYTKNTELTVIDILNNKKGVCSHITKLYNGFMYSLGYKCIYVSGYATNKSDTFNKNDSHSWSLIKVNDKWLPFDPTWGIFTGKLPVTHIFGSFFKKIVYKEGSSNVKLKESEIKGKFLE